METCLDCKEEFQRMDVWPHPEISEKFICRDCKRKRRLKKQKSFESDFRNFRKRKDYVPETDTLQPEQSRISDDEFDEIIREFEQAHWTDISTRESQTHHKYIESLFQREFWQRKHKAHNKKQKTKQQYFAEPDIALHYNMLGITAESSNIEVKEAYRRLILKWHPDKNPNEPKYAEKMLISIRIAFEEIMKSRNNRKQIR